MHWRPLISWKMNLLSLLIRLGYAPYNKTKIFVYNSIHDLQQSNVGIDGAVYTIGGRTDFVKLQLEVAYPGQANQFKEDLVYKLSSTLINDMMYGGSLAEIFQNSYLLTLPEWFIDGAARYIAYGWSREMDDYVRDYMGKKKIKKIKRIEGESAKIIGQSIWNYIAVKYGRGNISNVLNLTRIIRKEENSIANTLGVSFKTFLEDWKEFYLSQRLEVEENYVSAGEERLLEDIKNSKELITSTISFNKDADKVAYATLKNGKYQVYVTDLVNGNTKSIVSGGYRINGQDVDKHLPLLDWQDEYTLGVILFKRGFLYLNTFNLETGEKGQKPLNRFRQVESFSFNDNGRLAVISGDIDGQNDIFLIAMNRNALRRVTRDIYDDLDPVFVPGTAAIVFSSNRESDSVNVSDVPLETLDRSFNLFVYDLDTTTSKFFRLTNTYSEDQQPYARNVNEIYFLSDRQGISNLYRYNLYDSITTQLTNFDKSIISYDLHFDPDRLTYAMLDEGEKRVFLDTITDLSTSKFTSETPRVRRENALRVVIRVLENAEKEEVPEEEPKDETDTEDFVFEVEADTDTTDSIFDDPNWIDTDNYEFEDETETSFQPESFFSKYQSFEQENERVGPIAYKPRFQFNNVITSFLWDPYRNFMMFMETEINDVLENYKIKGGALLRTDFRQGDLFAEVQYLKYWMDFKARIDRKTYILENSDNTFRHKYKLNRFRVTAALPVTHTFRMEASPFYTETSFTNLNFLSVTNQSSDLARNSRERYAGGTFSLIFDNTVERSFNLYQGTRALIEYTTHIHATNSNMNFSSVRLDFRHYQKVHPEEILAEQRGYGHREDPGQQQGNPDHGKQREQELARGVRRQADAGKGHNADHRGAEHAPNVLLDRDHGAAARAFRALGILDRSEGTTRFAHQSHLDYLTVERVFLRTLAGEVTPIGWLKARDQSLFRRDQTRFLLQLLRDQDPKLYLSFLEEILFGQGVRFHIRHLALTHLSACSPPLDEEYALVRRLWESDQWHPHVAERLLPGNDPWLRRFTDDGTVPDMLASEDERSASEALFICRRSADLAPTWFEDVLSPQWDPGSHVWRDRIGNALAHEPDHDTDAVFEWRLAIARAADDEFGLYTADSLAKKNPQRAVSFMAAIIEGHVTSVERAQTDRRRDQGVGSDRFQNLTDACQTLARQAWDALLPTYKRITELQPDFYGEGREVPYEVVDNANHIVVLAHAFLQSAGIALVTSDCSFLGELRDLGSRGATPAHADLRSRS